MDSKELKMVEIIIYSRNAVYPGGSPATLKQAYFKTDLSRVKKLVTEALVSAVNDVNYGY